MRTQAKRTTTVERSRRGLWILLVGLLYVAQPALALAAACVDHACGSERSCCCDPVEPEPAAVEPASEPGCCLSEDEASLWEPTDEASPGEPTDEAPPEEPTGEDACGCSVESAPVDEPLPALPGSGSETSRDRSAAEWIRLLAERLGAAPSKGELGVRVAGGPPVWAAWELGRRGEPWTLSLRGAPDYLAWLSVARL